MGEYAVILESSEPLEGWDENVDDLVKVLGKTRYDVVRSLRNARGIVFDSLERARAERAARVLERMGRRPIVIPSSSIPPLDPVYTIRNADCTPEALMIQIGYTPKMRDLPWSEVRLICAGNVRKSRTRRGSRPGRFTQHVSTGRGGLKVTRSRETEFKEEFEEGLCDVFSLEPVLHLRFESKSFNYDYLGDRLMPNAFKNFCLFVSDLALASPNALLAADARAFAEGSPPARPREPAEFDAISRHALTLLLMEG